MNARLTGGDLQGWRYATFDEASSLVLRFFDAPVSSWTSQLMGAEYDSLEERTLWRSLFGINQTFVGDGVSMGAVRADPSDVFNWRECNI